MQVGKNKVVAVHYVLQVQHDDKMVVADKSELENPLTYLHGSGMLLPDFEKNLEGKVSGDAFSFSISASNGYGEYNEEEVAQIPKASFLDKDGNFDSENIRPGAVLPMQDNNGNNFQGLVVEINEDTVIMDFNHPLAGKDLHFSGSVATVREASAEEISHGHVHGPDGHHH
jgi:FKBP-type peptidyl-prolyl cis-trans isomerase SlyD